MPQPPQPADLAWCIRCRKVLGKHKGWFGAGCMCDEPKRKPARSHSAGQTLKREI
jgi:hypothetical protein